MNRNKLTLQLEQGDCKNGKLMVEHSENNNMNNPGQKAKSEGWIWLGVWLGLVFVFMILEIVDVLSALRQVFIIPGLAYLKLNRAFGLPGKIHVLDVDYLRNNIGSPFRVVVFTAEIFFIILPIYLYRKTRRTLYLYWIVGIAAIVSAALCWALISNYI
ncbi:MAG: hypothetical protein ACYSWP_01555 [Planctomycetota bacterium]